jgi:hypothetical protein
MSNWPKAGSDSADVQSLFVLKPHNLLTLANTNSYLFARPYFGARSEHVCTSDIPASSVKL